MLSLRGGNYFDREQVNIPESFLTKLVEFVLYFWYNRTD